MVTTASIFFQLNIDLSDVAIKQMRTQHAISRPDLRFEVMDVTAMDGVDDGSFACVLDKGTLDAMFTTDKETEVVASVEAMFNVRIKDRLFDHNSQRYWIELSCQATARITSGR